MAESPSHRFGQIVGDLLEEILQPKLLEFCSQRGLYLDCRGPRKPVRSGSKVKWQDRYGNDHDLDFVIEKNGSMQTRGRPAAFIEAAWRRYTKHSRAKAQEIQGAVLPIGDTFALDAPFLGVVLAGMFTAGSLRQLASLGFEIVHIPYESVVKAFAVVGIDARFDEATPDAIFSRCIDSIERLSSVARDRVKEAMFGSSHDSFELFLSKLQRKLDRSIDRITILPLFGNAMTFASATEAASFVMDFDRVVSVGHFHKFEATVRFSNGDEVRGLFSDGEEVVNFLRYVTS
jgi:hypothetical protein